METKHTPGPWRRSSLAAHYIIPGDEAEPICAMAEYTDAGDPHMIFENAEANARLIAAAPDMYAMLKTVEEFLSQIDDVSAILLAVATNAVLAKAEGKE